MDDQPHQSEPQDWRRHRLELRSEPKSRRLDTYLSQRFGAFSRSFFKRLIGEGRVLVNGRVAAPSRRLRKGDVLELDLPVRPERIIKPRPMDLDIIHEDDHILVINKPPKIMCHPGKKYRDDTLASAIIHHVHGGAEGKFNPGIVHRLDYETTGVMVVAKNRDAHVALSRQFEKRKVQKEYLALVIGRVRRRVGQIALPIGYNPHRRGLMSTAPDARLPRAALSVYRVLERFPAHTLVSVEPRSGRRHQIRVHFAALGHSVVGEPYYRAGLGPDPLEALMPRLALHAWRLVIRHPATRREVEFVAELPADFKAALDHLRSTEQS